VLTEGVFPLIPSVYVDNSLLTAVLLGVLVLFVLGELFGWPQSGLVVPGYLAGILVVAPEAAFVIALEAILTYALAHLLIKTASRFFPIDRAFGRDRFFLILVLSILVRLWVEQGSGSHALQALGLERLGPYQSIGLVLVPLTANALWMPGFFRGVPLVALPVLGVFLVLNHVLIPYTNLNLTHFAFATEDLSNNLLAAPKSHILLLAGCAVATRMNLRFGWEFGGILVPGLLAIAWMAPYKVLATFAEVLIVVTVFRLLMRLKAFRRANLSGLRPLVLAFVVAYTLKLVAAWLLGEAYPGFRSHELFGFGYLLPSLLAVRCWKRGSLSRILLPTGLASMGGYLLGSLIAAALAWTHPSPAKPVVEYAGKAKTTPAWQSIVSGTIPTHSSRPASRAATKEALQAAFSGRAVLGPGVRVDQHPDGMILRGSEKNTPGLVWFRVQNPRPLALIVPQAGTFTGLPEASVGLAKLLDAELLALSPPERTTGLLPKRIKTIEVIPGQKTALIVTGDVPESLDVATLRGALPQLEVLWNSGQESHVKLTLSPTDTLNLALRNYNSTPEIGRHNLIDLESMPEDASHPNNSDLHTLDRGVIQPLLMAAEGHPEWAQVAAWHAEQLGFSVQDDGEVLSLSTDSTQAGPHWTLWLRRGGSKWAFEVPTAGRHYRTLRVARTWWEATQGAALLVHDATSDSDSYGLQRARTGSAESIILRRLTLQHQELLTVSVSAYLQYENPGVDALLSDGRPILEGVESTQAFTRVADLVARGGGTSTRYTASPNELRFHDSFNGRRSAVELAGGDYITAYLSPTYRLRFGPLTDSPSLLSALQASELPIEQSAFDEARPISPILDAKDQAPFVPLLRALQRYAHRGHPGELSRIKTLGRRLGFTLRVRTESEEGIPYLQASKNGRHLLAPLCNFNGRLGAKNFQELREHGLALMWSTK